jgi:hypothetical protein
LTGEAPRRLLARARTAARYRRHGPASNRNAAASPARASRTRSPSPMPVPGQHQPPSPRYPRRPACPARMPWTTRYCPGLPALHPREAGNPGAAPRTGEDQHAQNLIPARPPARPPAFQVTRNGREHPGREHPTPRCVFSPHPERDAREPPHLNVAIEDFSGSASRPITGNSSGRVRGRGLRPATRVR